MLKEDAERNRLALVAQLYDDWHGYYVLVSIINGQRSHLAALSRDEALTYHPRKNEALLLRYPARTSGGWAWS